MEGQTKQLSYFHTPRTTKYSYSTVAERLHFFAEKNPNKDACVVYDANFKRYAITCGELYNKSCLFAKGLIGLGIENGDTIAISLQNSPDALISIFGVQLAGAVPLLFKFYRQDGSDICSSLTRFRNGKAIIFEPGNNDVNWNISKSFIETIGSDGKVKSSKIPSLKFAILSRDPVNNYNTTCKIGDICSSGLEQDVDLPKLDPDNVAVILLSSGSSGTQKAIQVTHLDLLEIGHRLADEAFGITDNDIYYNPNLFCWGGAYPFVYLYKGTTRVSLTNVLGFNNIEEANFFNTKAILAEKCTFTMLSCPAIKELITNKDRSNDWALSLKGIAVAGMPIPSSCTQVLEGLVRKFVVIYGTTELGAMSFDQIFKGDSFEDYNVGKPFAGVEFKVVDETGNIVPPNEFGEIYVRDSIFHLGYNDRELWNKVYTPSGWYKTDDNGCMRDNGKFIVTGRKSDVIIVGGELVSPSYIENIIKTCPEVEDVVVVPVSHGTMFQEICACIVSKTGKNISENTIREFFRKEFGNMPTFRTFAPQHYLFLRSFPKTPLGKNSRKDMIKIVSETLKRDITL